MSAPTRRGKRHESTNSCNRRDDKVRLFAVRSLLFVVLMSEHLDLVTSLSRAVYTQNLSYFSGSKRQVGW